MADDRNSDSEALEARIAAARSVGVQAPQAVAKGYAQGSRVLALLLGALVGGGVLGWAIDHIFGTTPWGLLIILGLAVIGAFMNIVRMSKERVE